MLTRKVWYEQGVSSVFYDVKDDIVFHYEEDRDVVHHRYGGRQYYESRTGLSGAGYITKTRNIILLSSYLTDCKRNYYVKGLPHPCFSAKINIFAPIRNHRSDFSFPFVIRVSKENNTEHTLVFCKEAELKERLQYIISCKSYKDLFKIGDRVIDKELYDPDMLFKKRIMINVINHDLGKGMDYLRFIDLREFKIRDEDKGRTPSFLYKLGIFTINGKYVKCDNNDLVVIASGVNPLENLDLLQEMTDFSVEKSVGNTLFLLKEEDEEGFLLMGIKDVRQLKERYGFQEELEDYIEYESYINKLHFLYFPEECFREVKESLNKKVSRDIKRARHHKMSREQIEQFILGNPEYKITIQDSLEAGNCEYGTLRFRNTYFPGREEVKAEELLPYIENVDVQRVFKHIFTTK